jgi:hypothetical protein
MARKRVSTDAALSANASAAPRRAPVSRAKHSSTQHPTENRGVNLVSAAAEVPAVPAPSREEVARLAYTYWEARGRRGGSPEEDWIRAERRLAAAVSMTSA